MDRYSASLQAFLAGVGSAFALFPTGQLDQFMKRDSVESRIHANFSRVGKQLDAAMTKAKDEQEGSRKNPR